MKPIIVFLHGLNNTTESFYHLGSFFKDKDFEVRYFSLYGHNNKLEELIPLTDSLSHLHEQIDSLRNHPYIFIGFSQGALDFQLAIQSHSHKPIKQILLAPAIKVKNENILKKALRFVPPGVQIKTTTPYETRMFAKIFPSYYKTIFEKIEKMADLSSVELNKIPTFIYVDPKDELIDIEAILGFIGLKKLNWSFHPFVREKINKLSLTKHHVLFHPEFFSKNEWADFLTEIHSKII